MDGVIRKTQTIIWDGAYVNALAIAVKDLSVDKLRTIAQEATGFFFLGGGITLAERLSGIRTQSGQVEG